MKRKDIYTGHSSSEAPEPLMIPVMPSLPHVTHFRRCTWQVVDAFCLDRRHEILQVDEECESLQHPHQVSNTKSLNRTVPYFYKELYGVLEMSLIIFQALYMCGRNLGSIRQRIRNEFSDLVTVSWHHICEA